MPIIRTRLGVHAGLALVPIPASAAWRIIWECRADARNHNRILMRYDERSRWWISVHRSGGRVVLAYFNQTFYAGCRVAEVRDDA